MERAEAPVFMRASGNGREAGPAGWAADLAAVQAAMAMSEGGGGPKEGRGGVLLGPRGGGGPRARQRKREEHWWGHRPWTWA